ncbi:hypothetical protein LTR78_000025 [Recurvomyces mirabilis]|uniref:BZIP domain-containing protein n=1 Tax=Recurvomyces mirabilis TaxID=574656 RepID=A0AAE0WWG8_9PEZI|nr:hypothetical protein LTR78_000025 [Recurvomyces mirabilis]KAK5161682.1 hypothetical protein LTS14_000026 [Recurvomyces mirabilis]
MAWYPPFGHPAYSQHADDDDPDTPRPYHYLPWRPAFGALSNHNQLQPEPDAQRMQTPNLNNDIFHYPPPPQQQQQPQQLQPAHFGDLTNFNAYPFAPVLNGAYPLPVMPQLPRGEPSVPLPPLRAPASVAPVTRASGPMSSTVHLKPRPKPGRKPIAEDDRVNIRRQQNRQAQRNFRDKRQQKLADTMTELQDNKKDYESQINEMRRQSALDVAAARKAARTAMQEAATLKRRYSMRDEHVALPQHSRPPYTRRNPNLAVDTALTTAAPRGYGFDPYVVTPPTDSAISNEIDFTSYGRRRSQRHSRTLSGSSLNGMQVEDMCGFCTDSANCVCRTKMTANDPTRTGGPGSCEACQNDPVVKAKCLALFEATSVVDETASPNTSTMACAEVLNQMQAASAEEVRVRDIQQRLGRGELDSYMSMTGPGFEIESHTAAKILQSFKTNGSY